MEPQKEYYSLFIFGNFKGDTAEGEILQPLIPITCDETLKYVYEPFTMTVQFDTDLPKEELIEYLKVTYKSYDVNYYIVPKGEEIEVDLPEKIKKNLEDLEMENDRVTFLYTKLNIKHGEDSLNQFDELVMKFMAESQDIINFDMDEDVDPMLLPKPQLPTMDDLLDRMLEGIELSLEEQQLLDRYANEYK